MLCEIISQYITNKSCSIPFALDKYAESSMSEDIDKSEKKDKFLLYPSLTQLFEIDSSSVYHIFEPMIVTSSIEEIYTEILPEEMLEYDIVVRMPPKKKYTIELEVKSIKKAKPKIIEPEWF